MKSLDNNVERQAAEERLRERERLAVVEAMSAILAHEIANPLNAMFTSVQILERHLAAQPDKSDEVITEITESLSKEIKRLRTILEQFHPLLQVSAVEFRPTPVNPVVEETLAMVAPLCAEDKIGIEQDIPADLPPIKSEREKLKQLLLNLCKNAIEAMPEGGTLTVRGFPSGGYVCLEVTDTGAGVPEGMDVFKPFTTSKPNATGLGLVIARQIALGHGGTITYSSASGHGTVFRVSLPASL